jgi:hypothetical protein
MLLDDYWERMNWKFPIYFSGGMSTFVKSLLEFMYFLL